jgi:hypothetical protein
VASRNPAGPVTPTTRRPDGVATPTKVEILYFDGCPTYLGAEDTVRTVLVEEGVEARVELVAIETDEETRRLRFPGSPTIRIDGEDLFPVPERAGYALGCRMYATPEGLKGSPSAEMVRAALDERKLVPDVS